MSLTITRKVSVTGGTVLRAANNLGDVADMPTTQANLGIPQGRNALAPANALVFDGTAGATLTNVPAFGTGDFTVAALINVSALVGNKTVAAGGVATTSPVLRVLTSGALSFINGSGAQSLTSTGVVTVGVPCVIMYRRAAGVGTFFINGVDSGSGADTYNYTSPFTEIGALAAIYEKFTGTIQLLGIANRAMSASEVLALYQTKTWPKSDYGTYLLCAPEANPLGAGTTWRDVSGATPPANITWSSGVTWALPWSGYQPATIVSGLLTANNPDSQTSITVGNTGLAGAFMRFQNSGDSSAYLGSDSTGAMVIQTNSVARFSIAKATGAATFDNSVAIANTSAIKGVRTATATYNFGTVSAGGVSEIAVTVTGAAQGDTVTVNTTDGFLWGLVGAEAQCTSPNTVLVRLANQGASPVAVDSRSFRVTVTTF